LSRVPSTPARGSSPHRPNLSRTWDRRKPESIVHRPAARSGVPFLDEAIFWERPREVKA